MVWGKKLLEKRVVLFPMILYLLPEGSRVNRPWCGWVGSLRILLALARQRLLAMSLMDGSDVPMIFSAVLTTRRTVVQSASVQLPDQTEMQFVKMLSMVPL